MSTIVRSIRPTCPACGFAVFNRRYPKCEKCQAELPASIAFTPGEIAGLRGKEDAEEAPRARRRAAVQAGRTRQRTGTTPAGLAVDAIDLGLDLSDLLDLGGN